MAEIKKAGSFVKNLPAREKERQGKQGRKG